MFFSEQNQQRRHSTSIKLSRQAFIKIRYTMQPKNPPKREADRRGNWIIKTKSTRRNSGFILLNSYTLFKQSVGKLSTDLFKNKNVECWNAMRSGIDLQSRRAFEGPELHSIRIARQTRNQSLYQTEDIPKEHLCNL